MKCNHEEFALVHTKDGFKMVCIECSNKELESENNGL